MSSSELNCIQGSLSFLICKGMLNLQFWHVPLKIANRLCAYNFFRLSSIRLYLVSQVFSPEATPSALLVCHLTQLQTKRQLGGAVKWNPAASVTVCCPLFQQDCQEALVWADNCEWNIWSRVTAKLNLRFNQVWLYVLFTQPSKYFQLCFIKRD